jgi:hypothetical protein
MTFQSLLPAGFWAGTKETTMKSTKIIAMFGLLIGLCVSFASRADAQCGVSLKPNQSAFARALTTTAERATVQEAAAQNGEESTIVGLWDVKFISQNQVVDEGYDQYHSDGTEILNDTPPPATGNVCLGVYERTGPRTLKLKHPSWIYDGTNTIVIGRATILEHISIDRGGRSFKGTFTIQFRDLSGNPLGPDFSGELRGDRITPD